MVFYCRGFYVRNVEVEPLFTAAGKKQQADERKSIKNGSKKAATDGGKKNAPKAANDQTHGTDQNKRADRPPGAAAVDPIPPSRANSSKSSANKSATSHPAHLLPAPAPVINQPVYWKDIRTIEEQPTVTKEMIMSWDDDKQLPGRSPRLQHPSTFTGLPLVKGNHNDDNSKKSLNNLDHPGHRMLELNDLENRSKLVLKMRLHCEGCIHKIRRAVKKFEGVEAIAFEAARDLVAVTGNVDEGKLVSYLEQKLKQQITVVLPARPNNDNEEAVPMRNSTSPAPGDEKHRWQPMRAVPIDPEKQSKEAYPVAGGAGKERVINIKPTSPATLMPTLEKGVLTEKVRGDTGTTYWSPPLTPWHDGVPATTYNERSYDVRCYGYGCDAGYQHLYQNNIIYMFSDENANSCSIM